MNSVVVATGVVSGFNVRRALTMQMWAGAVIVGIAAILASGKQSESKVPKFIGLLRADDPAALTQRVREGAFVTGTVEVFNLKLERVVGL